MEMVFKRFRFFYSHFYTQLFWTPLLILRIILTGKASAFHCVKHLTQFHKVNLLKLKTSSDFQPGCVYLSNHRSWADFFIDQTICRGASYLSRRLVIVGTPLSSLWSYLAYSTFYFERKRGIDRKKFFAWIEKQWQQRNVGRGKNEEYGIIVYPEGTRNKKDHPLKLKTGVLQYAFEYKKRLQIVITKNKEHVVNEKNVEINFGKTCVVNFSEVIDSTQFETFQEFREEIEKKFGSEWDKVYNSNVEAKDLEVLDLEEVGKDQQYEDVPIKFRLNLIRSIAALLVFLSWYKVQN
eukprot:snap_masked-scaffold_1-processed-gene-15.12-mRNA-1 protein AED:0.12 eAED:0.12 QI:0/-1/0/1/-1/1/1/0/293